MGVVRGGAWWCVVVRDGGGDGGKGEHENVSAAGFKLCSRCTWIMRNPQ